MRWQQIDIEQSTVRVGKRSIAIGEPILQMLSNGAIIADRVGLVFPGRNMGKALSNNSTEYRLACELSGVRWDARDVCAISKVVLKKLGHDYQQVFGCTSISEQERIAVNAADNEIMRMLGFPELTAMWVIPGLTSSEEKKIFGTSPCVLLDDAIDLIMEGAADAFLDMSYLMKLSTVFEH